MKITQQILDKLTEEAKASPRLRMNMDLRNSSEDHSQRMLNAIEPGSPLPIHRHQKTSETVVCLRGKLVWEFLKEECIPTPIGPYGESKIAAENYIIEKFAPEALKRPFHNFTDEDAVVDGKKVYIMRPCMIHGPGNKGNLNLLYGVVSKGIPWPLGAFENRRSFTSIGNLQEVIKGLLTKDAPSGIYHMGDDEALSTNELIEVICSALGKKAHIWRIPRGLMNGVARVGDWLHLPLNSLRMQKLTENYVVSNAKIKAALGMTAMPVRAVDGLRGTIESFAGK